MGSGANGKKVNGAEDEAVVTPAADMPARGEPSLDGGQGGTHNDDNEGDDRLLDEAGYGYGV
jgi:hypothetical protein